MASDRCGYVNVGGGPGEAKRATKKAHVPHQVPAQNHPSIDRARAALAKSNGTVKGDTKKWPAPNMGR